MGYSLIEDKEEQFRVMHEFQNQKQKSKHFIVKLPCHGASIELTNAEDTYVKCPECSRKYLITHSAIASKLYSEGK